MTNLARFATVHVLLACAGFSVAQVTNHPDGYLFRLKLHKGEALNFKIPFSIDGLGKNPLNLQFGMKLTVTKMTAKGIATVRVGKMDTGNLQLPQFSAAGGTFEVDPLGRVQTQGQMLAGFCIRFPQDPVPMGGHFLATVPVQSGGFGSGVQNAQATFKLVGFQGVGSHKCAKLTFRVAGNRAPAGSILVRLSDGVIDKYYTSFTADMKALDPNAGPLHVIATVIRQ